MLDVRELRAEMARMDINQKKLAQSIGMSEQTFIRKIKTGGFSILEAEKMVKILHCDPVRIFFAS